MNTNLNLKKIPKIVGKESIDKIKKCYNVLEKTNLPLYLVGPSGSSKTITALNLAKKYAMTKNVPAYYVQLSPELTKTSLILGLRLVNGSLEVVDGIVAKCMQEGGIIVVDEATHGTHELLLMFNSILDRTSVTSVGDKIVTADKNFRVIFCSNKSSYSGNIRLPQSFAQRIVSMNFDYPSIEDEIKIAKSVAKSESSLPINIPKEVMIYVAAIMRELRNDEYPLSARNIAMAYILLSITPQNKNVKIDEYFTTGQNVDAIRTKIASRIFQTEDLGASDLVSQEVVDLTKFVSEIGIEEFKNAIYSSAMYYVDVEGTELFEDTIKNKIENSII